MQINANNMRKGETIIFNNEPHKLVEVTHLTPGNLRAMVQTKMKNLKTGAHV